MLIHRKPRVSLIAAAILASTLALTVGPLAEPSRAIVGGRQANTIAAYEGSLQRVDSPRGDHHVCGATLIAPRWAVTAGHCVGLVDTATSLQGTGKLKIALTGNPVGWNVRFGSRDVRSGGRLVAVQQFVRASRSIDPDGDYALLKLRHAVRVQPVRLATRTPAVGTTATIRGWGYTGIGGLRDYEAQRSYPDLLRTATTTIAKRLRCGLPKGQAALCVGRGTRPGPDNMDSGGPVFVKEHGRVVLAGTVNGGNYISGLRPSVYTDLSAHRTWIRSYTSGRRTIPGPKSPTSLGLAGSGSFLPVGCTASVVRTTASRPSDPAMVLTNGHCLDPRPAPGEVETDRPAKHFVVLLGADSNPVARATTTRLLVATMTGTDIALYRLRERYVDLAVKGVPARLLASAGPHPGDRLVMLAGAGQTTYACTAGAVVPQLREAGYTQHDAIRYATSTSCDPVGGTSGSPLVDPRTGRIVAIHNTHAYGESTACAEGEPCEVAPDGSTSTVKGRGYAQQIAPLTACLTAGSHVDLHSPNCTLSPR